MKFKIQPYNLQEMGQRENQEDSIFPQLGQSTPEDKLFILCDGMGGHDRGEVASATVCQAMSQTILSRWQPGEALSDELLQQAVSDAFDALDANDNGEMKKMGTTMTFVCFHADGVTVAHMGDSRVYQLRPAKGKMPAQIVFRTNDHSLVNDLVKIGEITEEEAKVHPQKNVITRAMQPGLDPRPKAEITHLTDIQAGDYFYMCSDGMLEQTTDDNLLFIITKPGLNDADKVEMLRDVTSENKDNHTAHLIKIDKVEGPMPQIKPTPMAARPASAAPKGTWVTPEPTPMQQPKKKSPVLPIILGILAVLIIAAVAAFFVFGKLSSKEKQEPVKEQIIMHDTIYNDAQTDKKKPQTNGGQGVSSGRQNNGGSRQNDAGKQNGNGGNGSSTVPQTPGSGSSSTGSSPTGPNASDFGIGNGNNGQHGGQQGGQQGGGQQGGGQQGSNQNVGGVPTQHF